MDSDTPIVNGSQGIITAFVSGGLPKVKFTNGREMVMAKHSWSSERHPTISIRQVPLILAWAITIHKSQGATLNYAEIDAGNGVFECGQTYVALSRVRSLEGLTMTAFDPAKISVDKRVIDFYAKYK
jgi:ATP-dependent DNA helicase PIF1